MSWFLGAAVVIAAELLHRTLSDEQCEVPGAIEEGKAA